MTNLREIEGIGPVYAEKLEAIGINSLEELLEKGAHTQDREDIAEKSGLTYTQILEWVNRADLFRIKGVGSEYSDLLETAGVDTVMELAQRNPVNLTAKMAETDAKTDIVRRLPTELEVTDWIEQAKGMERRVWYEGRTRRLATDAVSNAVVSPLVAVVTEETAVIASDTAAAVVKDTTAIVVDPVTAEPVKAEVIEIIPLAAAAPIIAAMGSTPAVVAGTEPVVEAKTEPVIAAAPTVAKEKKDDTGIVVPLAAAAAIPLAAAALSGATTAKEEREVAAAPLGETPPVAPPVTPAPRPVPVAPVPASTGATSWPWLVGGLAALGAIAWFAWPKAPTEPTPGTGVAVVAPTARPAAEAAPVAAVAGANDILMLFDGGTKEWIEPAAEEFNKKNDGKIKIVLTKMGSREGRDQILYDKDKVHPVVWSPGDMYWVEKIKRDAADASLPSKSGATAGDAKPLLKTYLTLLMPEEKAKIFEAAMQKPEYAGKTWKLMHDLATKGWSAAGGPADWGKLKLAQTDPTKSNSGMAALTLMYQEWAKENPGKSINDQSFLQFMGDVQGSVGAFAPATSELIQSFVSEPGKADIAIVYESDGIRAIESGAKEMHIVYPSPTTAITVPAAVVQGPWVTEDQNKMGQAFVDYLATDEVQGKALTAGYRPANATLTGKATQAFAARQVTGAVAEPKTGEAADTKTQEGLIFNWNAWSKKKG